jgi:sugar lactone lactonase YvrE
MTNLFKNVKTEAKRTKNNKKGFLLFFALFAFFASTIPSLSGGSVYTQGNVQPVNDLPNLYATVENWAKMPEGRTWGATSAVEIDRDGKSIWVAERCGANTCAGSNLPVVLKFDASGKLVKSFGEGMFVFAHGIHVDRQGNVWVTDGIPPGAAAQAATGKGHIVVKFSPEGKVLLTLGKVGVAGDGPDTFNQPSDVVTAPNGDIFVADGHGGNSNARIVKFSKDGKFIKSWGKKGSGPGEFDTPHAIAMDSKGRLFVGDRNNNRIQIFDQEGKFLEEWKQFSRPSGIFIDKNDVIYVTDSESNTRRNPGWKRGIRIGSAKNGKVTAFIPDPEPNPDSGPGAGTSAAEGVATDAQGNVYGAEVGPRALKKYVKK